MLILVISFFTLISPHENCKFTASPSLSHPSSQNKLLIGSTCEEYNCEIVLLECFPAVHLSMNAYWNQSFNASVSWSTPSGDCSVMGKIDLSVFQPITMDILLTIEPQSCLSNAFESSTIHLHANHFQNFVANSTSSVLLSSTPSSSYSAPLSQPDISLPMFGVPNEDKFLYWTSTGSSYLNTDFSSSPSSCNSSLTTLQPIKLSPDNLLILHNGQLFNLKQNETNYEIISNTCFTSIKLASGLFNNPAYAITAGTNNSIISVSQNLTSTTILDDMETFLAAQSIYSYTIIDHIGLPNHSTHIVLIKDTVTGLQHIIHVIGDDYDVVYTFPMHYDLVDSPTVLDDSGSDNPLDLGNIYSIQLSSPHIVAVGTVALYSPSFGHSWYTLPADLTSENFTLIKHKNGRYAIQTPTNLYSGLFGDIIDISNSIYSQLDSTEFSFSALITFESSEIIQTFFNTSNNLISESHIEHDFHTVEEFIHEVELFEEFISSVQHSEVKYEICADHDPSYTRRSPTVWSQELPHQEECPDYIPSVIYLEYGASYVFSVAFGMAQFPDDEGLFYVVKNSNIGINLWNSDLVSVNIEKEIKHLDHEVVVFVNFTDRGTSQDQYLPGEELKSVSVAVMLSETTEMLHIALGCPPGLQIAFDKNNTDFLLSSHDEKDGYDVMWFQYEQYFRPVFKIIDLIGGTEREYLNQYNLTIIGGGANLDDLTTYSQELQDSINLNDGEQSVWRWDEDLTSLNSRNNTIRWLCREKSPCHDVVPDSFDVPHYCFIVKFSNKDIIDIQSYCLFETEFVLCIHSLPLGMIQSVVVLSVMLSFFFVVTITHYIKKHGIDWDDILCKKGEDEDSDLAHTAYLAAKIARQSKQRHSMSNRRRSSVMAELQQFKRDSISRI